MRLRRVGVRLWMATVMVHVAMATHKKHNEKAAEISRCKDILTLDIMKKCNLVMKHKRDVGEEMPPVRFSSGLSDLSVQTFVPDTNKAYARRQLRRSESDVDTPTADNEWDLYREGSDRGVQFLNPRGLYRIGRRYAYPFDIENPSPFIEPLLPLFPIDDPQLNPLNEEDTDDVYNDLLFARTPRNSARIIPEISKDELIKCCPRKMCFEVVAKKCSRF